MNPPLKKKKKKSTMKQKPKLKLMKQFRGFESGKNFLGRFKKNINNEV